jgi:hypothetical protein
VAYLLNLKHKNIPISPFKETKTPVWYHGNNTEITRNPLTHDARSGTLTLGSQPRKNFEIKDPNEI